MSGPGSTEQPSYGNPADFFNNGPQQGTAENNFFDPQNQQANWYPQPPTGELPEVASEATDPHGGVPMFYNPAEYNKGVANQPSFFDPYQQQQQAGAEQQQPQAGAEQQQAQHQQQQQQQPDMNQQQFQGDNYPNQWQQQQDSQWNYQPQQQQPQGADYNNYSDGSMPHDASSGQNFAPYGQPPYFSQQSNDAVQGNGDYGLPQNQWNQAPPVGTEMEEGWNDSNIQNQGENNVANLEAESKQENDQTVEKDEDSGGYIGMFHKDDDDESDFLESNKTENADQANQQMMPPPRTSNENEGFAPQGLDPKDSPNSTLQPYQPELVPPNQGEVPQGVYTPPSNKMVGNNPSEEGYLGFSGEQLQNEGIDHLQGNNVQPMVPEQQQQHFNGSISTDGQYLQNQFAPPVMNIHESLETNEVTEAESPFVNDSGSDIRTPSEHSSIAGSLPPSEPSGSSTTTSRSNSMLGDGGSNMPPNGVVSSEICPPETKQDLGEQCENSAPSDSNLRHLGEGYEEQVSAPPAGVPSQMQSPDNVPMMGQNVQVVPPPATDVLRHNTAVSDISNMSVPSTMDTNVSTTPSLQQGETEQRLNQNVHNDANEPSLGSGSTPALAAQAMPVAQEQDNAVMKQNTPQVPMTSQSDIQPASDLPQLNQPSGPKPGELPPPASNLQPVCQPPASNPQPVGQSLPNPAASTPSVHSQPPQETQSENPLLNTNPLISGTAHPSAFRTVRAQHNKTPTSSATVNPSPPLWSTEVPPLPSNILLAPAVPSGAPAPSLTTPSIAQPVKLDKNLAASIANVTIPPPPSEATSLLGQTPSVASNNAAQSVPIPTVPLSTAPSVNQVTQQMANMSVGQVPQPTLLPPASTAVQQTVTAPSVGSHQQQPQVPVQSVQSLTAVSQAAGEPRQVVTASSSAPALTHPNEPVKPVHPVAVLPGGQTHNPVTSSSSAQDSSLYQQQQQQGPNQPPPGQAQWYGGQGPYPYGYSQYQYHQDPRSQYEYDQYYRHHYSKHQHQSYYRDPHRPHSSGQGYEAQEKSYRDRDPMRSSSRQGYEQPERPRQGYEQPERPRSRQAQGYGSYDAYYNRYNRKDPRYSEYEEYNNRRRGYDQRYEEWYRNQRYYQQQQHQQGNRSREGYNQNRSGLDQSRDDSKGKDANISTDATDGSHDRSRFAADFHHQGGDTPERYGPNMSGIEHASPGYEGYSDSYNNRSYDYNYGEQKRGYDNGYGSAEGSGSWGYGYGDYQATQQQQQPAKPVYSQAGERRYMYASWGYGYQDGHSYMQPVKSATPPPPERLTPCKFNRPHIVARFSSGGQLIKVLPNTPADGQPAKVEIHSIESMLEHNEEFNELKAFPGPLTRVHTHKNDVVRFAMQKAEDCRKSTDITDKESAALLWDLMVLLCRQNGTIVGTDISELLLRDHPMTGKHRAESPPLPLTTEVEGESKGTEGEEGEDGEGEEAPATQETREVLPQPIKKLGPDIEKETHRFRELLLFGRKKEALESAVKGGLWGHALLLACKMDHRTHLSVMTRFANSLPMNDPLQTLYQLMSNRQPAAVTSCSDEKWGDWRPHLAMILSNLIDNADLDVKSITSLGDSLASRSLLHASHFCYLMAQIGLGNYNKKATKMVLLGASHSLPFKEFLRRPPMQQTEVYEYAQSLATKKYALPTFQVFKFIYATQLLDYGFVTQALHYCEVIATTIQYCPAYYSPDLITQVSELAHRLKYHDHQYFDGREVTEPEWLRDLDHIKIQYEEGAIQPSSTTDTPMPWVESYTNLSTMGTDSIGSEGMSFEVNRGGLPMGQQRRLDTPHSEDIGLGSSASQDGHQEPHFGGGAGEQGTGGYAINQSGYYQPTDATNTDYPAVQTPQQTSSGYDWNTQQYTSTDATQTYGDQQQQYGGQQQQQMGGNYAPFQPSESTKPSDLDLGASANSNFSEYSTTSAATTTPTTGESGTDTDLADSGASQAFDYYGMSTKTANQGNGYAGMGQPSPTDTMTPPDTPINRTRTRTLSNSSSQMTPTPQQPLPPKQEKTKEKKKENKPQKKSWFKGWFGGNKEIHLPDDKDKTIQWDEKKNKWVNMVDGEEEDTAPPPPPPKDHELSGGGPTAAPAASTSGAPGPGGPPTGAPPGVNKFSRKAVGRGNYVDVFNQGSTMTSKPSSMPAPSRIFDPLPATNAMPTNFFVPQGGSDPADGSNQPQVGNPDSRSQTPASSRSRQNSGAQQISPLANQQPQFFNPNSFAASSSSSAAAPAANSGYPGMDAGSQGQQQQQQETNLSRSSSMSSLSQEVSHINQQQDDQSGWQQEEQAAAPPPGPAPVTNPMMFNPQAFSQPTYPTQQPSSKRGYGTRRQYPTQR